MIKSDLFYRAFDAGFAATASDARITRQRGKASKYIAQTAAGPVSLWFKVNPKASALGGHPGEFWPELQAPQQVRCANEADDGAVSWYQYTGDHDVQRILSLQQQVVRKFARLDDFEHAVLRQMRDAALPLVRTTAATVPEPRFPSTALLYLDEDDSHRWGEELGRQACAFADAFGRRPETLAMYMGRVHWNTPASPPAETPPPAS